MIKHRKPKLSKHVITKLNKKKTKKKNKKIKARKAKKRERKFRTNTSKIEAFWLDFDNSPQSNIFTIKQGSD